MSVGDMSWLATTSVAMLLSIAAIIFVLLFTENWGGDLIRKSSAFTLVFALFAASYTIFEYESNRVETRRAKTLEYISRLQAGGLAESRLWLHEFSIEQIGPDSPLRDEISDNRSISAELKKFEGDALDIKENKKHVLSIMVFYSDVATCVNQGVCDKSTACRYFGDDMGEMVIRFNDFITNWRDVSFQGGFDAISEFVRSCAA